MTVNEAVSLDFVTKYTTITICKAVTAAESGGWIECGYKHAGRIRAALEEYGDREFKKMEFDAEMDYLEIWI